MNADTERSAIVGNKLAPGPDATDAASGGTCPTCGGSLPTCCRCPSPCMRCGHIGMVVKEICRAVVGEFGPQAERGVCGCACYRLTAEATEPLTEDTVQTIEAMVSRHHPDLRYPNYRRQLAAIIQDWRALRARIEALTTDWCECGHSRDKHQFFSDHDECYECDQASPDLCCEWRPAPRANENAALREQLAEARAALTIISQKEYDVWAFSECRSIAKNALEAL